MRGVPFFGSKSADPAVGGSASWSGREDHAVLASFSVPNASLRLLEQKNCVELP